MHNEYWLSKWHKNEIGFNQLKPHPLLEKYFTKLQLPNGSRIFVPLCGISIDMIWLLQQGYQVVGIEISSLACETFFKTYDLDFQIQKQENFSIYSSTNIKIICGDFFQLNEKVLGEVNAIYDRAALVALPAATREKYVHHLLTITPQNSKVFLISIAYDEKEMNGPPYPVLTDEINHLYENKLKKSLRKEISNISPHLQEKGLKQAFEELYIG